MHYQSRKILKQILWTLKDFLYNLSYFAMRSPRDNDFALLRNLVLSLHGESREKYEKEIRFLESMGLECLPRMIFPYYKVRDSDGKLECNVGVENDCPFIIHRKKVKLFFPCCFSINEMLSSYKGLFENEGLLGDGILEKSPHCYQDDDFKIEEGDVLLDVGCAEAIFALDNIEKISKAYLFECSREWIKPLKYTFKPYSEKVSIINKLVSSRNSKNEIRLVDALAEVGQDKTFFIKMDIEGFEREVISASEDFLKSHKVKLSCCVYHRQDDAVVIKDMLEKMGYKTRFSDGYMLPWINGIHFPYFRHGLIYAQNY